VGLDDDFYKLATGEGKDPKKIKASPEVESRPVEVDDNRLPAEGEYPPLDLARTRARNYENEKKIYIVRGKDLFVVNSNEISVTRKGTLRNISVINAQMLKYPTN
jgi:hypothetical protein